MESSVLTGETMRKIIAHALVLSALSVASVSLTWAQEGESVYKSKCAACHGATGEGKSAPALKTSSMSEDDVVLWLSKGNESKKAPHKKAFAGLTDDQIKAVAHYVKSLK
jgi:mono/diheme cytochrome c family protein